MRYFFLVNTSLAVSIKAKKGREKKIPNFNELEAKHWCDFIFDWMWWFHDIYNEIYKLAWNWQNTKAYQASYMIVPLVLEDKSSDGPNERGTKNIKASSYSHPLFNLISLIKIYSCTSRQYPIKLLQSFTEKRDENGIKKEREKKNTRQ